MECWETTLLGVKIWENQPATRGGPIFQVVDNQWSKLKRNWDNLIMYYAEIAIDTVVKLIWWNIYGIYYLWIPMVSITVLSITYCIYYLRYLFSWCHRYLFAWPKKPLQIRAGHYRCSTSVALLLCRWGPLAEPLLPPEPARDHAARHDWKAGPQHFKLLTARVDQECPSHVSMMPCPRSQNPRVSSQWL